MTLPRVALFSALFMTACEEPVGSAPPAVVPEAPRQAAPTPKSFNEDNTAELFDCLGPDVCPKDPEARVKRRAAVSWKCTPEEVTATSRPTKGLSVVGSTMVFGKLGSAEVHIKPGVTGGVAFDVTGCTYSGILACVPAHRTVHTADASYDNTEDTVCEWAHP